MKLKTLFGGLLFAAAIMTASSCEEMFKQMANVPSFFIPEVMYNGQSYQITRLATCKYEFTTDSKYLKVVENEDGKFIATASGDWVDETSKEFVEVNVTAVNPDNSSVEPQPGSSKAPSSATQNTHAILLLISPHLFPVVFV